MKVTTFFVSCLLTCSFVYGQSMNDSLDWRRYAPLEIGNEWQYIDAESGPISRMIIQNDTLVQGQHYFVGVETYFAPDGSPQTFYPPREVFMRYDTSGVVAEFNSPEADTGYIPIQFQRGLVSFPVVDLRADFGTKVNHPDGSSGPIGVSGGYEGYPGFGKPDLVVAAVKEFVMPTWFWSYAADSGFTGGGNLWGPRLRYARVGGIEYGAVVVSNEENPRRDQAEPSLFAYPNPASSVLTVSLQTEVGRERCLLTITDIIGRTVNSSSVQLISEPYTIDVNISKLAPGMYFVHVRCAESRLFLSHPVSIVP